MENTSGQGATAEVPAEIDRWNWGAFLLNWIWGIGNNTYRALLVFVPFVGFIMLFVLGAKGSAWAWKHRRWESVEQFKQTQRKWTKWGVVVLAAMALTAVAMFFGAVSLLKESEAFRISLAAVERSPQGVQQIGNPIETGIPSGSLQTSGPRGSASLAYSVSGPKGKGKVYVEATMTLGKWQIDRLVLQQDGTGIRTEIDPRLP